MRVWVCFVLLLIPRTWNCALDTVDAQITFTMIRQLYANQFSCIIYFTNYHNPTLGGGYFESHFTEEETEG